ncbi:ATP-binding protein [Streptomyces sp. NPDC051214]|uniref:ATP-binding protein n=1 Tax=Streptomyces sp. NPDC051214 TaxID=3155282 RepID=UPI0034265BB5
MSPDAPSDWPRENGRPAPLPAAPSLPAATSVPPTAAAARGYVRCVLRHRADRGEGTVTERVLNDVLLVVSELFTNALRHGGGVTRFEVSTAAGVLRVTVGDRSTDLPRRRHTAGPGTTTGGTGGYGWPLIRELATEIDLVLERGGGKHITVTLPLN